VLQYLQHDGNNFCLQNYRHCYPTCNVLKYILGPCKPGIFVDMRRHGNSIQCTTPRWRHCCVRSLYIVVALKDLARRSSVAAAASSAGRGEMDDNNDQAKHEVGKLFSSFLPKHMMHIARVHVWY